MSMRRSNRSRRQAAEQAAEWLVTLRAGKLSARERSEFVDWLRESPVHVAEILRASRIDHALGEYSSWSDIAVAATGDIDNVVTLGELQLPQPSQQSTRSAFMPWAAAAGLAATAVLNAWLFFSHNQSVIRTQAGERRELTLADGSVVDVAPSTELRVRLEDDQRLITLTRGQAFFHVASDANRPFIVAAGDTQVRAVGTAFDVARNAAGVIVTVVEGRVAVVRAVSGATRPAGAKSTPPADVYLTANEQVVVTSSAAEIPVREVNGAAEVAWTDGNLVFDDETVAEVVRRFNLYNRAQIQLLDEALAARRVSGVFKASDPDSFIEFVRSSNGDVSAEQDVIRLDMPVQ